MSLAFEGKAALVTGASRGIGKAIAERPAADGAAVVINYTRNEQLAQAVVNKILGKGGKAVAIHADISKSADVRRLFNEAEKAMARLDIVVANAGVHILKPFVENTEADYDYISTPTPRACFSRAGGGTSSARRWSHCRSFDGRHEDAFPQQLALSRKQRGYRAICPLPGGRTRSAQRYGEHSVAEIHRYGHDARAVPRVRRQSVAFQACRHAGGRGRCSHLSCK